MLRRSLLALALGSAAISAAPSALRDPWVPESARRKVDASPSTTASTTGAALDAAVEAKLRKSFDAADVGKRGSITREEASAGGFGFVAKHFDAIDAARTGRVTFEDLMHFLRERMGRN